MNLLTRTTILLSLAGSSIFGLVPFTNNQFSLMSTMPVQALPVKEIEQKLREIPVFMLTDAAGKEAITVIAEDGDNKRELGIFFFSAQEAQAVLKELQIKKPQLSQNAQVKIINLSEAYQIAKSAERETNAKIEISFQPEADEVQAALQLLNSQGKNLQQFDGVPMFYATQGSNNSLITVEVLDEQGQGVEEVVIPVFFSKEDLEDLLADMGQQNPQLAASTKIQVTSLGDIVSELETSNQPQMKQIVFIPSTEALKFIREQQDFLK